ncbi:MAG: type I-E CRISPR-associated protein Cas6/Cse3/CasE [Polyangiaceae bacterium]
MYLARAYLNPASRAVRLDLANPTSLHRTVMRAFPDGDCREARKHHGVLHRLDEDARRGRFVLLLQSGTRPDLARLPEGYFLDLQDDFELAGSGAENPALRKVGEERAHIAAGDRFGFRLRANTTRKILTKSLADGTKKNGKRVPVRGDDGRLGWLERHAHAGGFALVDVRVSEVSPQSGGRGSARITLAGAQFEGLLVVRDPPLFRGALGRGIGPGKAYGYGLLSITPKKGGLAQS